MGKSDKRPENTAFKQQRLKSWQPLLIPKSVIPFFFILGLLFIPLGMVLKIASDNVVEVTLDYTDCKQQTEEFTKPAQKIGITEWKYDPASNNCTLRFAVPSQMQHPVYMYYKLTNFYQNNRKYVKSFDLPQLKGDASFKLAAECDPLGQVVKPVDVKVNGQTVQSQTGAVYYPCGLIANSLFSDTIERSLKCIESDHVFDNGGCKIGNNNPVRYEFSGKNISWPGDAQKYKPNAYKEIPNLTTMVIPPPFWMEVFPQWKNGYNSTNFPDLSKWEDFQVWMRTAGLPTFRKLYGVNGSSYVPKGIWEITITQNYEVSKFGGTKSLVLSTASILGGKNTFLGMAYLVVGVLCVVLGVGFLARHVISPRILGDHRLLSWNEQTKSDSLLAQN